MLSTGNDLHKEYASNQLSNKVLLQICLVGNSRRPQSIYLEKQKMTSEEGGANTLFIALGMLKWKENPRDEKSFKAPLILIQLL